MARKRFGFFVAMNDTDDRVKDDCASRMIQFSFSYKITFINVFPPHDPSPDITIAEQS